MQDYRKLKVWQQSHQLVLRIYKSSRDFPTEEKFGLTSQMRRAAASIPANLAEGSMRSSDADFLRFVHIAMGSAAELDYHLLLARDLEFIAPGDYQSLEAELSSVRRMLAALSQKLKSNAR